MHCIDQNTSPVISCQATIASDVSIGPGVCVYRDATICRGATIGMGAHVGAASLVLDNVRVPAWAIIDNGMVVGRDYKWSQHKRWNV